MTAGSQVLVQASGQTIATGRLLIEGKTIMTIDVGGITLMLYRDDAFGRNQWTFKKAPVTVTESTPPAPKPDLTKFRKHLKRLEKETRNLKPLPKSQRNKL